jgi:hypothetical protein
MVMTIGLFTPYPPEKQKFSLPYRPEPWQQQSQTQASSLGQGDEKRPAGGPEGHLSFDNLFCHDRRLYSRMSM